VAVESNLWDGGKVFFFPPIHKKKSFPVCYAEFTSNVHEVTPEYLADIESEKPLRQTLARELWLQTEHLWTQFPGFIEALRNH